MGNYHNNIIMVQGVVTATCLVLPSATRHFDPGHYALMESGYKADHVRLYTSPFTILYKKSRDLDARKSRSSNQASFKDRIKRSSAHFGNQNS